MGILIVFVLLFFSSSAWAATMPIGIPDPGWGIETSHTMYADCDTYKYDYGSGLECYKIGPDGPYTHYIKPSDPNATDTDNPYGTVAVPRLTRPNRLSGNPIYGEPLPAGSVVEMHAGAQGGLGALNISGTANAPIFIRGVEGDEPTFAQLGTIGGNYIVIENLKFDMNEGINTCIGFGGYDLPVTHVAVRNCEFYNGLAIPTSSYQVIRGKLEDGSTNWIQNLIFYRNEFHDIGEERDVAVKNDAVGISFDTNVRNVWIIENQFYYIGGDGIQLAWDSHDSGTDAPQYIYIGKNTAHDNYENFLDLKGCKDVIVSQNTAYNFGDEYSSYSGPTAIAFRYGPGENPDGFDKEWIWTLFNVVYNTSVEDGAFYAASGGAGYNAENIYYIGNVVYNCHDTANGDAMGMGVFNMKSAFLTQNIVYGCDKGIQLVGETEGLLDDDEITFINNIVNGIHDSSSYPYALVIGGSAAALANRFTIKNNIYYDNGTDIQYRVGVYAPPASASWSTYTTYSNFATAYPHFVTNSMAQSPAHIDAANADFRLSDNSPAIGAGYNHDCFDTFYQRYGINIRKDFEGKPIGPNVIDIGAYHLPPYSNFGTSR